MKVLRYKGSKPLDAGSFIAEPGDLVSFTDGIARDLLSEKPKEWEAVDPPKPKKEKVSDRE